MIYTQQEVNEIIRKEHQHASFWIFAAGILGILAGRCSNSSQLLRDVKCGVAVSDSATARSFQPGDTIKVILINEKQR